MENVRKHIDFELVNTPEHFQNLVNKPQNLVNKPNYTHSHIISEDLVGVEKDKHTVELYGYVCSRLF